ncbi:uncharacterized protein LOC117370201 isoform X2 [Periophthalmus magnuspinnatus]|uniref:uncharacterized protein LOC117370201 isoform X2 n=1 Tax=Periophthalmus magnuspinnatus TaxID=409849 RepID=UPI002436CF2F|nr:uncharacterized protein LOC117370201 isoform X2 [Periophthalmus magnuspinnatus]
MEIWLLLTAGMVSSTSQIISLEENQTETKIEVIQEGSNVSLHCRLWPNSQGRCKVIWLFNSSRNSKTDHKNLSDLCSTMGTYTLDKVFQNNSGWYSCESTREIPNLQTKVSNWIRLIVNPENPPFVWSDWMWIALGATGLVLVILVIVFFMLRRGQLKERECPIYANTRPGNLRQQPSPRAAPSDNTLKTNSSYQNLRTPEVSRTYEHSRRLSPRQ